MTPVMTIISYQALRNRHELKTSENEHDRGDYTGLVNYNRPGGVKGDMTLVQRGIAFSEYLNRQHCTREGQHGASEGQHGMLEMAR